MKIKILLPQLWQYFNNLLKCGQMEFARSEGGGETKSALCSIIEPATSQPSIQVLQYSRKQVAVTGRST
jgi:hypothetical protein